MRAVALLGPYAQPQHLKPFATTGVSLCPASELDPADESQAALIFGGDGTLHRHLGGLAAKQIPALVVPMGSANDFAHSIGLGTVDKARAAWQRFCAIGDNVRALDLGTIRRSGEGDNSENAPLQGQQLRAPHFVFPDPQPGSAQSQLRRGTEAEGESNRTAFFACIAGTGLDATVNRLTLSQSHWLRSHGGYVIALLQGLPSFRPSRMTISVNVDGQWRQRIDAPGFLVAAGNGPQYGHGMRITHQANMNDGLLDLCFVKRLSKLRLLRLFRLVYRGSHIGMKEVDYLQTSGVRIVTDPVTEVFADGEYICTTPVEIGVRSRGLKVIL